MADPQRIVEARRLLAQLGVTVADLHTAEAARLAMPTVAEYLPQVIAAAGPGARRTYGNYWSRMAALWGDRRLDAISATDVEALQRSASATAVSRRNGRGGRHAGEHVIAAARAFFVRAVADGLIAASASPAHQIAKPRRLPSARRALTPRELAEINDAAGVRAVALECRKRVKGGPKSIGSLIIIRAVVDCPPLGGRMGSSGVLRIGSYAGTFGPPTRPQVKSQNHRRRSVVLIFCKHPC